MVIFVMTAAERGQEEEVEGSGGVITLPRLCLFLPSSFASLAASGRERRKEEAALSVVSGQR